MLQEAEQPVETAPSHVAWEEPQRQVTRWKLIAGVLVFMVVFVLASQVMFWLQPRDTKSIDDRGTGTATAGPSSPSPGASSAEPDKSASSQDDDEPKSSEERTAALLRAMREHAETDATDSVEKEKPRE